MDGQSAAVESQLSLIKMLIEADGASPRRIVVVGDAITDVYVHGRLERCQEECPKFVEESRVEVPGGAGNAARSLEDWCAESILICPTRRLTSIKTRFMEGTSCAFRHDDDIALGDTTNSIVFGSARDEAIRKIKSMSPDAVLISDYDKGFLTEEFISWITGFCARHNTPCVADVKRRPEIYAGCILKGNTHWLYQYKPNLLTARMVITNGRNEPAVEGRCVSVSTSRVNCVNHIGAGDCFAAHLTLALAHRMPLRDAAAIAHSAGRVYVQYPHNRPPQRREIEADARERESD